MDDIRYLSDADQTIEIKKCSNRLHTSRTHFHDEVSIGLIERGSCLAEIGGQSFHLTDRTLLIIPAGSVHYCLPLNSNNWQFRMAYVNKIRFGRMCDGRIKTGIIYDDLNQSKFSYLIRWFRYLETNLTAGKEESESLVALSNFIDLYQRNFKKQPIQRPDSEKIDKTRQYLNRSYRTAITIDELSELAGMDKYSLIRRFHERVGMTPQKYLINLRINFAKKLLRSRKTIADIAAECGFYDQSHFTKSFKAYAGVTPIIYRRGLLGTISSAIEKDKNGPAGSTGWT